VVEIACTAGGKRRAGDEVQQRRSLELVDERLLRRGQHPKLLAQSFERRCRRNKTIFTDSDPLASVLMSMLMQPPIGTGSISVLPRRRSDYWHRKRSAQVSDRRLLRSSDRNRL
jgi:hypothetical protein